MSSLVLVLALACTAPLAARTPSVSDEAYARIQALLSERRLGDAYELLPEVGDPLLAARARAEISYLGRDFGACVAAAKSGLAVEPGDLTLLYRALTSALWLRDGDAALAWSIRLEEALQAAELTPDERSWWTDTTQSLRSDAEGKVAAAATLERRVGFARWVASGALALVLVSLTAMATRPSRYGNERGVGYG